MSFFKYVEKITSSDNILTVLKQEVTGFTQYPYDSTVTGVTPVDNNWKVVKEVIDTASNKISELTLKGTMSSKSADGVTTLTKDFYVKFISRALVPRVPAKTYTEHSTITVQVLENPVFDVDGVTITGFEIEGYPVEYQWANEQYTPTDRDATKPVYMYLNIMNNRLAMVLVADPAVNFNDYRKSFLYVGAIKPFAQYNYDDVDGNVALTAGAVIAEPSDSTIASSPYYYGVYTSPGNNTIQMLKTKSRILYQKHYPSFITQAPPTDKSYIDPVLGATGLLVEQQGFQASRWTQKYHLSPLYVVHPYEGYRGQLDYVIAVTKHNILHLDELIVDVTGQLHKQEVYRYFDINTEQNLMNLSPNQNMSIAILKEIKY